MKLFGFLFENGKDATDEYRPPFTQQIRNYIEEKRLKIKKNDRAFKVKAIILITLYIYLTGTLTTVFRYFGEITHVGFGNSPKPSAWPWDAVIAIFDIKYSIIAILITLTIITIILGWWIRNHIGLGDYELQERNGLKFKKQAMDATLGSAREMTPEEMAENFTVTPASEFKGRKNSGSIVFGRDIETGDYVAEKQIPAGERPNRSTITVGTSGCFKTGSFIIPLILQLSRAGENMIINDPSTEISKATYNLLKSRGYDIKIFNVLNPEVSDGWNFIGAVGEDPILSRSFARMIIDSSAGKGEGDSFWSEGMYVLLSALILYVNRTSTNNTIEEIRHILNNIDLNDYPALFERLPKDHPARMEFNTFMTSPVQRNVQNGTAQRLSLFNSAAISKICSSEGIDIIRDFATPNKKSVVFIVASDVESSFSFIPSLFLIASVVQLSDYTKNHIESLTLPQCVHYIMDEFSNTARVEDIGRYLSSTRKYGIVFHLIVQSFPQFYKRYDENEVDEIVGQCEHVLCFGSGENKTAKFFEEYCGPTTVRTGMTSSNSVILKNTDQYREGEQQRMLYFANEILTMEKHEYLLLTNGQHPLKLKKAFWKNFDDSQYVEDFTMKNYIPQSAVYKAPSDEFTLTKESHTNHKQDRVSYGASFSQPEFATVPTVQGDSKYKEEGRKKRSERSKKNKTDSYEETPPMFQKDYYVERDPINADEVVAEATNTNKKILHFKDNKMSNGKPRQAVLLRYKIDGTDCRIEGNVPGNRYIAVKSKLDLNELESECRLSKENCILKGWVLSHKRGDKTIEARRIKIDNTGSCVNENGELLKSYSFTIPQADCMISPIFEAGKGANKNEPSEPQNNTNEFSQLNLLRL